MKKLSFSKSVGILRAALLAITIVYSHSGLNVCYTLLKFPLYQILGELVVDDSLYI